MKRIILFAMPWLIWVVSCLFMLYQFFLQVSVSVMVPQLMVAFSVDSSDIGILSSSYFFFYLILQVPAGMLVDRFGARCILTIGFFGCLLACYMLVEAQRFWLAEVSRLLMGLTTAPAFAAIFYLIANWFHKRDFALLVGLTEMLGMLGGMASQLYLAYSLRHLDFRQILWICLIVGIPLAVLTYLIIRDRPQFVSSEKITGSDTKQNLRLSAPKTTVWQDFNVLIRIKGVWVNGLFAMALCSVLDAFAVLWCVPFIQTTYSVSLQSATWGSALIFLGIALGAPLWAWLLVHFGRQRIIMSIATIICCLSLLVVIYVKLSLPWLFISLFISGFSSSVYVLCFTFVKELVVPHVLATAMGLMNVFCMILGSAILQPLIGYLIKWHAMANNHMPLVLASDYRYALIVLPLSVLGGLVLVYWVDDDPSPLTLPQVNQNV